MDAEKLIELVERVCQRDRDAIREFYELCAPVAFRVAFQILRNKEDAEEITQDAVMKALSSLEELKRPESLLRWVSTIATHLAIDLLRRRRRSQAHEVPFPESEEVLYPQIERSSSSHFPSPADVWSDSEALKALVKMISPLEQLCTSVEAVLRSMEDPIRSLKNPDFQKVVILKYRDGLSLREVATQLNWYNETAQPNDDKVKTYLARARKQLADEYRKLLLKGRWQQLKEQLKALRQFVVGIRERQGSQDYQSAGQQRTDFFREMQRLTKDYRYILEQLQKEPTSPLQTFMGSLEAFLNSLQELLDILEEE